ncbi:Polysaccharide deacetylase [Ascosphaera apis ARSEF 7405]|uniref:chitin deacetylase n=1 Tax=Ascosphaera apis ARSEF 7405 TaxID=392613 RepID=A0A167WH12_9EURO|nr:Polysaccharide deacetylase [Ascosphaera apis ARSEF 7405]
MSFLVKLILSLILLLFISVLIIYRPPFILIRLLSHLNPDVLWFVRIPSSPSNRSRNHTRTIALTIDDGPTPYTRDLSSVLDAYNARATFFIIGSHVKGREDVLREIVSRGHEVGNHTMYDVPSKNLSVEELKQSIEETDRIIHDALSQTQEGDDQQDEQLRGITSFFRPGSGFFTTPMRSLISPMGKQLVLGCIFPHDPIISSPAINARHVLSCVRDGGIIVMHDGRPWSAESVRRILDGLAKREEKRGEKWDVVNGV